MNTTEDVFKGRLFVETTELAQILCIQPQTARRWAALQTGPFKPVRAWAKGAKGGKLLWPVSEIKKYLVA